MTRRSAHFLRLPGDATGCSAQWQVIAGSYFGGVGARQLPLDEKPSVAGTEHCSATDDPLPRHTGVRSQETDWSDVTGLSDVTLQPAKLLRVVN